MSSKKLDAAIDALVDALAELPEHEGVAARQPAGDCGFACRLGNR